MSAELYGSSQPETEGASPVPVQDQSGETTETTRVAMETSVLDALRPLLRSKKRKLGRDDGEGASDDGASEGAVAAADLSGALPMDLDVPPSPFAFGDDPEPVEDEFPTFAAIGQDLDRRSRQGATMVRLLEQHRQQLVTAEKERDAAYEQLARVVPVVQETAQALRDAMDERKVDEDSSRMHKLFMLNGRALDELEKVATTLFADFLWVKSAWEQYANAVEDARKLRSEV